MNCTRATSPSSFGAARASRWPGPERQHHARRRFGAGKTTLVRHLLQALGVAGRIKSPTYAVVEPYSVAGAGAKPLAIWHFDFYRFNDPDEWEEAGFRDIFAGPGLKLVEWPDKAGRHLPAADLRLCLETIQGEGDAQERRVSLHALTPAGAALMAA
jgi:tRNA threonylcarbamoyladenosine biosynthesis protein TsaE